MTLQLLKIAVWNANGLQQHADEVKTFIKNHNMDIMLISETHFTKKNYFKVPKFTVYHTQHPDGTAHGGTAIIIKNTIKHHEISSYRHAHLQATSIIVEDWTGPLTISALYCPPKHAIKKELFQQFFDTLGNRFIAGGDYNAKHPQWGSRLATTKGRELLKAMEAGNLQHLSTGEPTYWPTDRRKSPDVIDFCVTKGISNKYLNAKSCLDLSSDHSPIIITLSMQVLNKIKPPTLYNKKTDWNSFRSMLDEQLDCSIPLKTEENLDVATRHLSEAIQRAAWKATPEARTPIVMDNCPISVQEKIAEKRKLRKRWHITRATSDKQRLNRAVRDLKVLLHNLRNQSIQRFLTNLTASAETDYSLWKATKNIKQAQQHCPPLREANGEWARNNKEKSLAFAYHLAEVFKPHPSTISEEEEDQIHQHLEAPHQMDRPIKSFRMSEVKSTILKGLNPKKAPGFDLITGKVLRELPEKGMRYITILFNAILRLEYFPDEWKVAKIILIPKAGKNLELAESYRPISLLPVLSKIFERLLLTRLNPLIIRDNLIPEHQFGFRQKHATVEQVHRIVEEISNDLENKRYCSAVFLDVSQAFDKVWHEGLLYKLKTKLPHHLYQILKSYLSNRQFLVKHQDEQTQLFPISSGVPQGSVLGPTLYLLYTADLPTTRSTTTATFADDAAVLSSHWDPILASTHLQENLFRIENWLKKWRIKVNETKSSHVTFTMRRETCPPVIINGQKIPQSDSAKYLGIHLDRRLTWQKHIFTKRKQLGLKLRKMYWLVGRKSQLSLENKLLLYKSILKPIWTYGIQLWGAASNSNVEILERFQSKVLRSIVNAPWYITNAAIQRDLRVDSVKEEIQNYSIKYRDRLRAHPNKLAVKLYIDQSVVRRLKRFKPSDLPTRFS